MKVIYGAKVEGVKPVVLLDQLSILIGPNGCGKSRVLDAISYDLQIDVCNPILQSPMKYSVNGDVIEDAPFLAYYPDHWSFKSIPVTAVNIAGPSDRVRFKTYSTLTFPYAQDALAFFGELGWIEFQKGKSNPIHREALEALASMVPDVVEVRFSAEHGDMELVYPDRSILLSQAGSGIQRMLMMVMDMIHRAIRVNPHIQSLADMPGCVLIDNPETHLHVSLQGSFLRNLMRIFPKVQFIVATHSPEIVGPYREAILRVEGENE